jgi:hypothetical protein
MPAGPDVDRMAMPLADRSGGKWSRATATQIGIAA